MRRSRRGGRTPGRGPRGARLRPGGCPWPSPNCRAFAQTSRFRRTRPMAGPAGRVPDGPASMSALQEGEQVVFDLVLVCRGQTVRRTGVVDVLGVRDDACRALGVVDWN